MLICLAQAATEMPRAPTTTADLLFWAVLALAAVIAEGARRIIRAALAYRDELRATHREDVEGARALATATATVDAHKVTIEGLRARITDLERQLAERRIP